MQNGCLFFHSLQILATYGCTWGQNLTRIPLPCRFWWSSHFQSWGNGLHHMCRLQWNLWSSLSHQHCHYQDHQASHKFHLEEIRYHRHRARKEATLELTAACRSFSRPHPLVHTCSLCWTCQAESWKTGIGGHRAKYCHLVKNSAICRVHEWITDKNCMKKKKQTYVRPPIKAGL